MPTAYFQIQSKTLTLEATHTMKVHKQIEEQMTIVVIGRKNG